MKNTIAQLIAVGAPVFYLTTTSLGETNAESAEVIRNDGGSLTNQESTHGGKMIVDLQPHGAQNQAQGNLALVPVGNVINVTGRLKGLAPMKVYHLALAPGKPALEREAPSPTQNVVRALPVPKSPNVGMPDSDRPNAGTPDAGRPDDGKPQEGQPDGTSGAGAAGSNSQGTPIDGKSEKMPFSPPGPESEGFIETVTADANGESNVNATLRGYQASSNSLANREIALWRSANRETGGSSVVSSGRIENKADKSNARKSDASSSDTPTQPRGLQDER